MKTNSSGSAGPERTAAPSGSAGKTALGGPPNLAIRRVISVQTVYPLFETGVPLGVSPPYWAKTLATNGSEETEFAR